MNKNKTKNIYIIDSYSRVNLKYVFRIFFLIYIRIVT